MIGSLDQKFKALISKIYSKPYIDEKTLNEIIKEIQRILLSADVNVKIVLSLSKRIKEKVLELKLKNDKSIKDIVIKVLYDELVNILGGDEATIKINKKPYTILFVGLEGSGKTTTVAKLAKMFADEGYRVGVFSLDIHRPAAIEQLFQLIRLADPSTKKIIYYNSKYREIEKRLSDSINSLKECDIILIDTAGRHKNEESLIEELGVISKKLNPDFVMLVIDSYMGQKAYDHTVALRNRVRIDGITVTKMDGSAKGGGAISAAVASGASVYYIGTGEKLDDIEKYDPKSFVSRLLGIGDISGFLARAERVLKREKYDLEKLRKLAKGRLTLLDVVEQFENIEKLGGLYKILSYLPGFSSKLSKEDIEKIEEKLKRWRAAIDSMTMDEKLNPEIIKGSRLVRISRGSGVDEKTIKDLIKQYKAMKKMLKDRRHKRFLKEAFKSTI